MENRNGEWLEKFRKTLWGARRDIIWLEENLGFANVIIFPVRKKFQEAGLFLARKMCEGKITIKELLEKSKKYAV